MRYVLHYLRPKLKRLSVQMVIKFIGTLMDLALPMLLAHIINEIAPSKDLGLVALWGGVMALCAVLCWLFNVTANRMSTGVSRDVTRALRHDLFVKIGNLSCAQADGFTLPSLVSRMTSDAYNVHVMVDRMQRLGVRAPILLLGGIFATLALDPVLTLVLVTVLPILALVITLVSRRGIPLYTDVQKTLDKLVRKVQENMNGVRVIKALSKSDYEKSQFDSINRELSEQDRRAGVTMALSNPIIQFILNAGLTLVVVVGAYRVNLGLTQPGTILAFLNYFILILNAVLSVTRLFVMYSKGAASAARIAQVLDAKDEQEILSLPVSQTPAMVEFKDVSFSYNKRRDNLSHVSFTLKKGETLGVIGATGSGKSTLLSLLLRLYDADKGDIYVGGQNVRAIKKEALYAHFGVVFQNDFLYADTLRANIDFSRDLTDEQIRKAAKTAQADFILEKEGAFQMPLSIRGQNLSGGQRQRVLIARAIAAHPDILLLDDCSSALDYETEARLRQALFERLKDAAKIIVSQRVSALKDAKEIIVLNQGKVIGQGTHDMLYQTCAAYRDIYNIQTGQEAG